MSEIDENIPVCDPVEQFIDRKLTKMELGELRRSKKLTQKQVADITGLSVRCVSDIESESDGNPTLKNLIKYLNCMGYEICFQKKQV